MNYAIIAAGEGSRLAQEGVQKPKPLVELNGEPMVERLMRIFERCNAESISIIVNEHMTQVREFLDTLHLDVPLNIVVKTTPSSMHSFWELSKVMQPGKFCLTTVDTIFREPDFARYIAAFEADKVHDGLWAVTPYVDDEKPLYVEVPDESTMRITAFTDKPGPEGARYVSGGIYAMSDKAFAVLDRCIEQGISRMRNFQRALIEAGFNLKAYSIDKIVDVDHASDIATAQQFINQ
ncbi:nucleotidyltransferase family protein [Sodaliphilus pleomorphus]|jgi:NDP-sugar pyrophosphorylase family protein|uniref:NDP-sugar synthase n=1 Tax=Sodaliphilus pleomorphus TaxID=2606626 RepID=A0A6L5XCL2_9BACT|nr:NDP-sugar synthase [Sodaliphilus pleomorphus]MDY6251414.1 NDP-sugar synthase [Bacteroidales bacterium]MDD6475247.1 NDP-sugar synthase [Sodaliphilus pleomorphus]MDD6686596.1 NDP-sugar synthase [Sodaliphilus pleomorphus]MDY6259811.1 NDP-sugar synthase [Bacteroidales bacterium]MSS17245.1 NDP-sugar synthase [Sodaliphilus pleomorphus]